MTTARDRHAALVQALEDLEDKIDEARNSVPDDFIEVASILQQELRQLVADSYTETGYRVEYIPASLRSVRTLFNEATGIKSTIISSHYIRVDGSATLVQKGTGNPDAGLATLPAAILHEPASSAAERISPSIAAYLKQRKGNKK